MDSIWIKGKTRLLGETRIQGSKNAALPILAACVLVPGITVLENCPDISDMSCMCRILNRIGVKTARAGESLIVDASQVDKTELPSEEMIRMRSSVILTGALLGRCREVSFCQPGGCVIGDRPIDMHIGALKRLGAVFAEETGGYDDALQNAESHGMLRAEARELSGAEIHLPFPSVGATQNAVLAAVLAKGITQIQNCAREPEIVSLCRFLKGAGAKIAGEGSSMISVQGTERLHGSSYRIGADRIVAGTYLLSCTAAGGEVFLREAPSEELGAVIGIARRMGAAVREDISGISVSRKGKLQPLESVETGVYPGFPTDLQSALLTALCSEGKSVVTGGYLTAFRGIGAAKPDGSGNYDSRRQGGDARRQEADRVYCAGG
ncbi:MAG: UDP-N-acetylglucosamine 1-carboxyvinyltransferase [Eisenbergiella sp.]